MDLTIVFNKASCELPVLTSHYSGLDDNHRRDADRGGSNHPRLRWRLGNHMRQK